MDFEKAVRQAARLADIDFVHAVVIDISHGDAIAAVDVDAGGRIEPGAPIRNAASAS